MSVLRSVGKKGRRHAFAFAITNGGDGEMHFLRVHLGAGRDGIQARLQAFEGAQQFAGRAVKRKRLQHVRQLPAPQPVFEFRLALAAQQLFQCRVGAAFGNECQGVVAGAGDFQMLGQGLAQGHFTELVEVDGGVGVHPRQ
ncbi:hypothetical protein D3C87_1305110 [compost metagenome]